MQGKNIVWIIATVILIMSGVAFFVQSGTSGKVNPLIMNELINPYKELISNGNYETAYSQFTSVDYKVKFTLNNYLAAQDSNMRNYGELKELRPVSGVFLKESAQGNKVVFKATFAYIGSKASQRIIIDAIKEDGKFKIYNTYNSYVSIGNLMPVIY